ncbi:hypothetical protein AAMO2058_001541900 [Amorphochlora amoebiformis]
MSDLTVGVASLRIGFLRKPAHKEHRKARLKHLCMGVMVRSPFFPDRRPCGGNAMSAINDYFDDSTDDGDREQKDAKMISRGEHRTSLPDPNNKAKKGGKGIVRKSAKPKPSSTTSTSKPHTIAIAGQRKKGPAGSLDGFFRRKAYVSSAGDGGHEGQVKKESWAFQACGCDASFSVLAVECSEEYDILKFLERTEKKLMEKQKDEDSNNEKKIMEESTLPESMEDEDEENDYYDGSNSPYFPPDEVESKDSIDSTPGSRRNLDSDEDFDGNSSPEVPLAKKKSLIRRRPSGKKRKIVHSPEAPKKEKKKRLERDKRPNVIDLSFSPSTPKRPSLPKPKPQPKLTPSPLRKPDKREKRKKPLKTQENERNSKSEKRVKRDKNPLRVADSDPFAFPETEPTPENVEEDDNKTEIYSSDGEETDNGDIKANSTIRGSPANRIPNPNPDPTSDGKDEKKHIIGEKKGKERDGEDCTSSSVNNVEKLEACIICGKPFPNAELQRHVNTCIDEKQSKDFISQNYQHEVTEEARASRLPNYRRKRRRKRGKMRWV